ncbi:hypothetical protein LZ31DRAFT_314916 [Colletotrichum somersetense]|nr:hypothetical protein LZ31DRAFT_314916 [Colletotrichum somersetense]
MDGLGFLAVAPRVMSFRVMSFLSFFSSFLLCPLLNPHVTTFFFPFLFPPHDRSKWQQLPKEEEKSGSYLGS